MADTIISESAFHFGRTENKGAALAPQSRCGPPRREKKRTARRAEQNRYIDMHIISSYKNFIGYYASKLDSVLPFSFLILAGLSFVVLALRVTSIVAQGSLYETTGVEGTMIHGVWRASHSETLYSHPYQYPYALTFYNFLFYITYGRLAAWFHVDGRLLSLVARFITLGFALIGMILTYMTILAAYGHHGFSRLARLLLALIVFEAWLGTMSTGWWALSVRPDVASLAFAALGFLLVVSGLKRGSPLAWDLAASTCFFGAWAVKQSTVAILAGVSLAALLGPRPSRRVAAITIPCGALMAATLWLGGPNLVENIILVPADEPFVPWRAVPWIIRTLVAQPYLSVGILGCAALFLGRRKDQAYNNSVYSQIDFTMLVTCFVALGWTFLSFGKTGASKNHALEFLIVSSTLFAGMVAMPATTPLPFRIRGLAIVGVIAASAIPALQLAHPGRIGEYRLATADQFHRKSLLAQAFTEAPEPKYSEDRMLAQPWYSTHGRYPAVVLDHWAYRIALAHGRIRDGGIEKRIEDRYFGSVLLPNRGEGYLAALRSGYVPVASLKYRTFPVLTLLIRDDLIELR